SMTEGTGIDPVELHRRTNGNPFYVTEVLSSGASGVPATVRDAVLARAARLSRSARSVLDAAATIGAFVRDDVLREVAQADAGTIDECLASGVLQSYRDGYAFRHEIG